MMRGLGKGPEYGSSGGVFLQIGRQIAVLGCSLVLAGIAVAADGQGEAPELLTIRQQVIEVAMEISATDKKGHAVRDLRPDELVIWHENSPVENIRSLTGAGMPPLRVAVLLDSSESVAKDFPLAQEAAAQFIETVIRPGLDEYQLADFNERLTIRHQLRGRTSSLSNAMAELRAGGKTKAWDALIATARQSYPQETGAVRRVLILISDGIDAFSLHSAHEAVDALQAANVTVYAISTNTGTYESDGDAQLRMLANETGGRLFFPENSKGLTRVLRQIADDLSSAYVLFYPPPSTQSGEHRVQVACKRKGVTLRYRPVHHFQETYPTAGRTLLAGR